MSKMTMVDWSQLPHDLIGAITTRLDEIEDVYSVSDVCTSWRSGVLLNKRCNPNPNPRVSKLPWLLLNKYVNGEKCRWLWSFHKHKHLAPMASSKQIPQWRHRWNQPIINNAKRCWGSPTGWVFTFTEDTCHSTRLINPLTRAQINLPPVFPCTIERALVFIYRTNLVVMAIFQKPYRLALTRPGFTEWIKVQDQDRPQFADVACYKDQVFGVRLNGAVALIEIDGQCPKAKFFSPSMVGREEIFFPPMVEIFFPPMVAWPGNSRVYLIESAGDLLMALEYCLEFDYFEVYKLNLDTRQWVRLSNLGGRALFVGDNYSMSVPVAPTSNLHCSGNCIYYTRLSRREWKCNISYYHMVHRRIYEYSIPHLNCFSDPVWVMPSFN